MQEPMRVSLHKQSYYYIKGYFLSEQDVDDMRKYVFLKCVSTSL